jgi:energy-coupling factor transporter ATP-binding protein EcfA2
MATTILLYGRTGSGKTTQLGVLAEDVFKRTGKVTRIYSSDRGGYDTIRPYIDLGIIEVVELGSGDIWIFVDKASQGYVKDSNNKWVLDKERNNNVGAYCFESAHGMAKMLQQDMEVKAGRGAVIGGDANTSFDVEGDGEKLRIGATKGFQKYAIPQTTIANAMMRSQKLDAEFVVWTAGVSKDEDDVNTTKIIGPQIIGQALTGIAPGDFNYTFRQDFTPAKGDAPAKHIIFLGPNTDVNSGNATALGNIRRPIDAPALTKTTVEPANLVTALKMVREDAAKAATEAIKKRLGMK